MDRIRLHCLCDGSGCLHDLSIGVPDWAPVSVSRIGLVAQPDQWQAGSGPSASTQEQALLCGLSADVPVFRVRVMHSPQPQSMIPSSKTPDLSYLGKVLGGGGGFYLS